MFTDNRMRLQRPPRRLLGTSLFASFVALLLLSTFFRGLSVSSLFGFTSDEIIPDPDMEDTSLINPPTWEMVREYEEKLPQHDLSLSAKNGRSGRYGRYVLFDNQISGLGWNNQLHEVLMNSLLAHESMRAYVFRDFIWSPGHYPWPKDQYRPLEDPPRTPLNALLSGPSVGGQWGNSKYPLAVSEQFFNKVCMPQRRKYISTADVKFNLSNADAKDIFETWQPILYDLPDSCVVVVGPPSDAPESLQDKYPQVFDLMLWGSERLLSIWGRFRNSDISWMIRPSSVVDSAILKNGHLFQPKDTPFVPRPLKAKPSPDDFQDSFDRTLAVHIRRGDYEHACKEFARWNSSFYGWNQLPVLPDKFIRPLLPSDLDPNVTAVTGWTTEEHTKFYLTRCWPTKEYIVEKLKTARSDYYYSLGLAPDSGESRSRKQQRLRMTTVYVLTNADPTWLSSLTAALRQDGWLKVITTLDLKLSRGQKEVAMAVDMEIARRSRVFVGNGWSSLTSNVVHRRMSDDRDYMSIRLF